MPSSSAPTASPLAKYADDWLLPDAELRYAASRHRARYRHYEREQAVVGGWLRRCPPGALVLDLPCGTGRFSELVAACGHRLIRADLSWAMVAHARRLGPNQHVVADICCDLGRPPLKPGCADVVLVWRLFHHCRTPEDRRLLLERAAVLARRYVIVSFYNRASVTYWARRLVQGVLRRPPKARGAIWTGELLAAAEAAGLQPVQIRHFRRWVSINSAACLAVAGSAPT